MVSRETVLVAVVFVASVIFTSVQIMHSEDHTTPDTDNITTISEVFTGSKSVYYTHENSDFNITIIDKSKDKILILDAYNVVYRIEKTGKIDTTDNITVFYNTQIGKQYKGNFYTVYYENMTFCRIESLNYIKC